MRGNQKQLLLKCQLNQLPRKTRVFCLGFFLLIALIGVAFLAAKTTLVRASGPKLTLQQRVAYQRTIEKVYWRHRLWPKENPQPKPPLETVMPESALRAKVEDALRQSEALEVFWQRPLSGEQLQAEMDRMAHNSKQPEVLRELWAALNNDPFLIAECLARPALAERLLRNWSENDERLAGQNFDDWWKTEAPAMPGRVRPIDFAYRLPQLSAPDMACTDNTWTPTKAGVPKGAHRHTAIWTGSEMIVWGGLSPGTAILNTGGRYNPATDTWTLIGGGNVGARYQHSALWTGTEMIVWGGSDNVTGVNNTGGRYNPLTNTWVTTTQTNAPSPRVRHTAIWTGNEMIVWGGTPGGGVFLSTGGRYNPNTDNWTPTNTTNAPSGKSQHSAVWTGNLMIVWGGAGGLQAGSRYNPASDSWAETSMTNAPAGRLDHQAVWTGIEMIVWGGINTVYLNSGGRYNPTNDSWTATTMTNVPDARSVHTAIWTGDEMLIWGGGNNVFPFNLNTGSRYNPALDKWTSITTTNAPVARSEHSGVWTGTEMIVWGGQNRDAEGFNTGGRYNPGLGTWTPTNAVVEIEDRTQHTAVWTGSEMIVWGGTGIQTGGRYNPSTDNWSPTSLTNVPEKRINHTAVWTGAEMIIFGGFSCCTGCGLVGSGGRYNPATNSWTATNPGSPIAQHTAVWTGSEMIVWGGRGCGSGASGGGQRYNPTSNSWQTISSTNAPSGRYLHTAVWTGNEMIVWGGDDGSNTMALNTGGRYNPTANNWTTVSTTSAPFARENHTAIWTGNEMIVWGGYYFNNPVSTNTGGRYNPTANSWIATTMTDAPSPRWEHAVVWTGDEMIVWGGIGGPLNVTDLNTGGRYNPLANAWRATDIGSAPTGRNDHTAIWTGSEMIIFGGEIGGSSDITNTGGRYCALPPPLAISPTSQIVPGPGGMGTINVFASVNLNWTATSNAAWITINSGASGSGNGSVSFTVAANPNTQPRTGTITIDTQTFTVNQEANCTTPINLNQTINGALVSMDCPSTQRGSTFYADQYSFSAAAGQQVAILLTSSAFDTYLYLIGPNGTVIAENDDGGGGTNSRLPGGSGFFALPSSGNYAIEVTSANPATTGNYTISLTAPSCLYQITPANQSFTASGGGGAVNVFAGSGCAWTAASNDAWITINSGASGSGSGAVTFTVAANTGAARSGTMTIAGRTFTVNQAEPCSYSIAPTSQNFAAMGGGNSVGVTSPTGCTWMASSNAAWITINSGSSGSGNGSVNYTVATNAGPQRSGTMTIAGQTFTVNQDSGCTFTINPISQNFVAAGGNSSVAVNASDAACAWTATSNAAWIMITSGASGSGNGAVNYTVAANPGPQRSGTVSIAGQTFTVNQSSGCSFGINPTNQNFAASGGGGNVTVTASDAACGWTAASNAAWITITSGASGSGNGSVGFTVAANTGPQRSGTITVAGQTFTVTQGNGCTFSINPTSQNFAAAGGTGSVGVTAGSGCNWTAASNAAWITITSGSSGSGNGTVGFSVADNPDAQRSGTLTIAGQTFSVTQDSGCLFIIVPTGLGSAASGTSAFVDVNAGNGCLWTAVSNAAWITITSGLSGNGTGIVNYTVAPNTGPQRIGTMIIAGRTFTVTQDSGCAFSISPASQNFAAAGGSNSVGVTAGSGCDWTAASNAAWITITSGAPGSGNGTVNYTVAANSGPQRSGTMTIAGQTFTVTQDNGCTFSINPSSQNFAAAVGSNSVGVTAGNGCNWTATSNAAWITITSGTPGSGNGTLNYTVAANTGPQRSGTMTIAGQTFTVTQDSGCTFSINPSSQNFTAAGGSGSTNVTAAAGCAWTAQSNAAWITLTTFSGTSNGTVGFVVAVNAGPQRTGTATIAGQIFTITQDAFVCPTITVNPVNLPNGFTSASYGQTITASGGSLPYNFAVTAGALPSGVSLSPGGLLSGTPATAGTFNFTITATDANNCTGVQAYTVIISGNGLQFYPLPAPVRLLDTRSGVAGCVTGVGAIAAGSTRTQAARTACSTIPANATAIIGNITVVPSGPGFLTLFPSDATQPTVANSNFKAGEVTNNFFTVGLGGDGAFKIFTSATTEVIVDLTGYYAPPGAGGLYYHPLPAPVRLVQTFPGQTGCFANPTVTQLQGTNDPNANPALDLAVDGRGVGLPSPCNSIPSDAVVLVGNATTVFPNAPFGFGYLTIYPSDATRPTVASSNYGNNDIINGPFAVKLGADGKFKIYTFSTTHLVIDVSGYYSTSANDANGVGLLFNPLPKPMRLLETRADFPGFPLTGCYRPNAPIPGGTGGIRTQQVWGTCSDQPITIPNAARAVVGNVTVINPANAGFGTFFPGDVGTAPTVATTNYPFPVTFGYNRHYYVGLSPTDGTFKILTQFTSDYIVDVSGYFAP